MLLPLAACANDTPDVSDDTTTADTTVDTTAPDTTAPDTTADTTTAETEPEKKPLTAAELGLPVKEHPDPTETRLLSYNIVGKETAGEADRPLEILDLSAAAYKNGLNPDIKLNHDATYGWNYGDRTSLVFSGSFDLTEYEGYSIRLYAEEEDVGATFLLYFSSENSETEGIDYYSRMITVKQAGWNMFSGTLIELSTSRSPLGWDKIDLIQFTSNGWNQNNKTSTTLYLDSFTLHTNADGLNSNDFVLNDMAAFSIDGSRAQINDKNIEISYIDDSSTVFEENGVYWLPLSVFAAYHDPESTYNASTKVLTMTLDGKKYVYDGTKNTLTVDGKSEKLSFTLRVNGDSLFVPHTYAQEMFGYSELYADSMGVVVLSNKKDALNLEDDLSLLLDISYATLFTRPTGTEIAADMLDNLGGDVHPRIMLTEDDFDQLREYYKTDETFKSYVAKLVSTYGPGSKEYNDTPVEWQLTDGVRLLAISREAKNRIIPWCMLYQLTGNELYVNRVWKEVKALCEFKDWHPEHFLDTAEICYPMAIAYDWLYDCWTDEQRETMEQAMLEKGLKPALERFGSNWTNNWNGVCNGGLTAAALAYLTALPEECMEVLELAVSKVENGMFTYAPDGGYLESPGYWSYGTDYLHVMFSSLDSACGTDYGLYNSPGFAESAYFTAYFETEIGSWGFHDSSTNVSDTNFLAWFAKKSNDPSINRLRKNSIDNKTKSVCVYDVMWYDPDNISDTVELNLDAYYSEVGAVTMRDTWDKGALFVGIHGGDNAASHGDLDIGNFFLDASGKRFIEELGSDDYNIPDYFGTKRWNYYRKRAEGQNTLVIGDVSYKTPDQKATAVSEVTRVENNDTSSIAVVDMAPAYDCVTEGQRGLMLTDDRSTVILQDEIHMSSAEIVRWSAHTKGTILISEDGRSAFIERGGYYLYCEIVSADKTLKFSESDAVSFDENYPTTSGEYSRKGISKLMIITPDEVTDFNVAVAFKVIAPGETAPGLGEIYTWTDIDNWELK